MTCQICEAKRSNVQESCSVAQHATENRKASRRTAAQIGSAKTHDAISAAGTSASPLCGGEVESNGGSEEVTGSGGLEKSKEENPTTVILASSYLRQRAVTYIRQSDSQRI